MSGHNIDGCIAVIDLDGKGLPNSTWVTPAGTSGIGCKFVAQGNEHLLAKGANGYRLIQRKRTRFNSAGSDPFIDVTDGQEAYGVNVVDGVVIRDSSRETQGADSAKVIEYAGSGASGVIEDWSGSDQVPVQGAAVWLDANPSQALLDDANSVSPDELTVQTT